MGEEVKTPNDIIEFGGWNETVKCLSNVRRYILQALALLSQGAGKELPGKAAQNSKEVPRMTCVMAGRGQV